MDLFKKLLAKGVNINLKNNEGITPLHFALSNNGSPELIKYLLEQKADMNLISSSKNNALHFLYESKYLKNSESKYIEIFKTLIENKVDPNLQNTGGITPFHFVLKNNGSPELIKLLLEKKADMNLISSSENNALHFLCESEDFKNSESEYIKIFKTLIENKVDPNLQNKSNKTPVDVLFDNYKGKRFELSFLEYLRDNKVDLNENAHQLIGTKGPKYNVEDFQYFLNLKIDFNFDTGASNTPISSAIFGREDFDIDPKAIEFLIDKKVDFNLKIGHANYTPLYWLCLRIKSLPELVNYVIENKKILEGLSIDLNKFLGLICNHKNISLDLIKLLVENKADLTATYEDNKEPPLHNLLSQVYNDSITLDMIKYLHENKADLNMRGFKGNSPLIFLSYLKFLSLDMIKYLVENNADLNIQNDAKVTPLKIIIINNNVTYDIIKYFIDRNADANALPKNTLPLNRCLDKISNNNDSSNKIQNNNFGKIAKILIEHTDLKKFKFDDTLSFKQKSLGPVVLFEFLSDFKNTICLPFLICLKLIKANQLIVKPVQKLIMSECFVEFMHSKYKGLKFSEKGDTFIKDAFNEGTPLSQDEFYKREVGGDFNEFFQHDHSSW